MDKIDTVKDILNLFPEKIIYKGQTYRPSIEIVVDRFEICYYNEDDVGKATRYMCFFDNESLSELRNEVTNYIEEENVKAIWR